MDLLQSLLKKNKEERITWREFFSHPFIARNATMTALTTFKTSTPAIPISHGGYRFEMLPAYVPPRHRALTTLTVSFRVRL
jgi:hypothetical protein